MKSAHLVVAGAVGALLAASALSHGPRPGRRPAPAAVTTNSQASQNASGPIVQPTTGLATPRKDRGRPGNGGRVEPRRETTVSEVVHGQVDHRFVPGQDGSVAWNTTRKVGKTPIMLYLFNCEDRKGENFEFARQLEQQILRDKKLVKAARDFTCEKLCHDSPYFLDRVEGREMLHPFVAGLAKKDKDGKKKKVGTSIVFLDSTGKLISAVSGAKKLKKLGARGLMKEMEKAAKENEKRLAASP